MAWMRETRIVIFMQVKLDNCKNELVWLIRCHDSAAEHYPEEEYPPRPLPIPTDDIEDLQRRLGKTMKHLVTHIKDDPQHVLSTTSPPSARSSTAAANFIMLAKGTVENLTRSAAR